MATRRRQTPKDVGEKRNLLNECNTLGMTPQEFMQTFCRRCRNYTCTNAGWADSAWEARMRTQVDRLFEERIESDPNDPRYEEVRAAEFPSLIREAIKLNLADERGDWSIPSDADVSKKMRVKADEINFAPPADEDPDEGTSSKVDDALEALTGRRPDRSKVRDEMPKGFIPAPEGDSEPEPEPIEESEATPEPESTPEPPGKTHPPQRQRNNAPDQTGKMIGGPTQEPSDPWAVPKKPENVVDVGATVTMKKDS